MEHARPAPKITPVSRPFWEGVARNELMIQRCRAPQCGKAIFFPRVCCPHCGGGEVAWERASGRGRIASYSAIHRPQHESFYAEAPYFFVAVELEEGALIYSRLLSGTEDARVRIGAPVEVAFVDQGDGRKLPYFALA